MESIVRDWARGSGVRDLNRALNAGEYIPTWTLNSEQFQPSDVRRYVTEGYGRNSLIFSCIAEKATSFAALNAQVVRSDGTVQKLHRVSELLANPNPEQDGQDFAEQVMTQYEAAGNAFVRKIRVSRDPDRQREFVTWPVQELEAIRPDYVTIKPGLRRADDVFVVTVGGKIMDRIPRRDMIHLHEPLIGNDFYGESKLARLQREGSVDLSMSDFELAFFKNAGVPMGLLKVKGRHKPEEIDAVKSKFKAAYNGVRKWFELLVLNMDEADFTPLGTKQSDMEMDSTRFHAESRICSVFGVPGALVGARFAMGGGGGTITTYEDASHAFWAETMVPASMRFARAWEKFLLPEFATTRDRGARITYDFTQVRSLQEDRSRKLREVVRMINTGAFTINQALVIVGMDQIEGGDFYIRNGNQVVVSLDGTVTPMGPGGGKNPDNPLVGAARLNGHGRNELDAEAAVEAVQSIFANRGFGSG